MTARADSERGQAIVLTVAAMVAVLGVAGLVLDAGAWFRARRHVQAVADAGALAGAQKLPQDPGAGRTLASQYVTTNGGDVSTADVRVVTTYRTNDTAQVTAREPVQGFFTRIFGTGTFNVSATAKAVAVLPGTATGVAPFAIDYSHEYLIGPGCPCFDLPTELDLDKLGPGAFKVIDVDGSSGGIGPSVLADWIRNGYPGTVGPGWYFNDPGAKFNPSQVKDALTSQIGHDLLFPVYNAYRAQGAGFQYRVVAWTGFHITGYSFHGSSGQLQGWFTPIVWQSTPSTDDGQADYGAHTIELTQ